MTDNMNHMLKVQEAVQLEIKYLRKEVQGVKEEMENPLDFDGIYGEIAKKASCGYVNAAVQFQHFADGTCTPASRSWTR